MTILAVVGGEVLAPDAQARWRDIDIFVEKGRIVPGATSVRTCGETVDGAGGPNEVRTGGAGAERASLEATVEGNAVTAARYDSLAAAGYPRRRFDVLDAAGLQVVPGFIDLQCNGGYGIDLSSEPERLWELAALLPRTGVTAWLPTIVTGPPSVRDRALAALQAGPPPGVVGPLATPLGLHIEGPFLAPERRGAHNATWLCRPADEAPGRPAWSHWSRDVGVALVTLAPELPGALDLVRTLTDRDVVVSIGHSSATAAQATAAVDAGVRWITHLFNAMAPLHHREPGVAGVALVDDRVRVGVIVDGLHLHPATVALAARALGDRLTLVTDAVAALGLPPGPVRLGGQEAMVADGVGGAVAGGARLADGTLAGSDLSLDRAVRNLCAFADLGATEAVAAATSGPAAVLGITDRGVIAPGAVGDLVLLDDAGEVVATVVAGEVAYDRRTAAPAPGVERAAAGW